MPEALFLFDWLEILTEKEEDISYLAANIVVLLLAGVLICLQESDSFDP